MKRSILKGLTVKVFLSHVSNEAPLAMALKKWIETAFDGHMNVFVSGAIEDLRASELWLDSVRRALCDAEALLVLCSPYSVTRSWVLLESGGAWVRNIPIISICHSRQKPEHLPPPLSFFQALELSDSSFFHKLVQSLVIKLKLKEPPPLDENPIKEDLRAARKKVKKPDTHAPAKALRRPRKKLIFTSAHARILKKIAKSNNEDCTCQKLAGALRMEPDELDIELRYLTTQKLLTRKDIPEGEPQYLTTEKGLERIVQGKQKRKRK